MSVTNAHKKYQQGDGIDNGELMALLHFFVELRAMLSKLLPEYTLAYNAASLEVNTLLNMAFLRSLAIDLNNVETPKPKTKEDLNEKVSTLYREMSSIKEGCDKALLHLQSEGALMASAIPAGEIRSAERVLIRMSKRIEELLRERISN